MTSPKRARLRYPIGSRWKIRKGLRGLTDHAGKLAVVKLHELDDRGGMKAILFEVFGGVQWWSVETADELLEAEK